MPWAADFLSDTALITSHSMNDFLFIALHSTWLTKLVLFFGLYNFRLWQSEGLFVHFSNKLPFNRPYELRRNMKVTTRNSKVCFRGRRNSHLMVCYCYFTGEFTSVSNLPLEISAYWHICIYAQGRREPRRAPGQDIIAGPPVKI